MPLHSLLMLNLRMFNRAEIESMRHARALNKRGNANGYRGSVAPIVGRLLQSGSLHPVGRMRESDMRVELALFFSEYALGSCRGAVAGRRQESKRARKPA
jgi:hypothetical protein